MQGLLSQTQGVPQEETSIQPPIVEGQAASQMGGSPMDAAQTEEASSPEVTELLNSAVDNIYSEERLPKLKQLFQESGHCGISPSHGYCRE
jgi:hypothetical protein